MAELGDLIREERSKFIAVVEALDAEQWRRPSLCDGWTVGNVVAHVAWAPTAGLGETFPAVVRAGLRPNRMIAELAVRWTARGRMAALEQLVRNRDDDARPLGVPRIAALTDAVVHGLDVRVPLGVPSSRPSAEAFAQVADWVVGARWPITHALGGSARHRLRGRRLIATDTPWSWGSGTPVEAPSDVLLLLVTGRRSLAAGIGEQSP